jgi:hypothetical protein
VSDFRSVAAVQARVERGDEVRIAYEKGGFFVRTRRTLFGLKIVELDSAEDYVKGRVEADAMMMSAERASIVTMVYPQFSVVVPQDYHVKIPTVFAVKTAPELERLVNTWIQIREDDSTVGKLFDYWILGQIEKKSHKPRWSIIRDVLGWVE